MHAIRSLSRRHLLVIAAAAAASVASPFALAQGN